MDLYDSSNQESQHFEQLCLMLLQDDPMLTEWRPHVNIPWRQEFPIDDVDAGKLGLSLKRNTHLGTLTLALDFKLTERGARTLAFIISQSRISSLKLVSTTGANSSLLTIFAEEGVAKTPSLRALTISGFVGNFSWLSTTFATLETLHLFDCKFSSGIQVLSDGLSSANCVTLEKLVLTAVPMDAQDMMILASGLRQNSTIKTLYLSGNGMGDEGIVAFVEHWDHDSVIEDVRFSSNRLGVDGVLALIHAVPDHPSLTFVDVGYNKLGFIGIERIAQHLPQLRLNGFVIDGCDDIDSDESYGDFDAETKVRAQAAGQAVLRGIQQNVHLHYCSDFEPFPGDIQDKIALYLELNKCGRYLMSQDGILPGLWSHVLAFCGDRADAIYFFLREQPQLMLSAMGSRTPSRKRRKRKLSRRRAASRS